GLEVLKRLREDDRTKRVPVVILTTSTEQDDLVRAGDLHANSYVRKPVDFDTFVGAARQLGLYWPVLNEPAPRDRSWCKSWCRTRSAWPPASTSASQASGAGPSASAA